VAKKLLISFKETEVEILLYLEVIRHIDKSAFIKECIKVYLENKRRIN
jgi:hypothetical protein